MRHYFTVGLGYATEPHPFPGAHPEGYAEVNGANYEEARKVVMALMGDRWGFQYGEDEFDPSRFHRGAFLRVNIERTES